MVSLKRCRAVDVAAAQLIVREAGGAVAFPEAGDGAASLSLDMRSRVLAARDESMLRRLRDAGGTRAAGRAPAPRVRAVLRRSIGSGPGEHLLSYGGLELDEDTRDVWRDGRLIELTPTEFKLLHYLMSNARRVLTRDQILEAVWDYNFAGNASVLETYVSYLRAKIDTVEPPLIHTVRGVGYSLRLPPS